MESRYELYLGDCLEVMPKLPPKSIDAVITDPPYGTTACKWDSIIPFDSMWKELKRVSKDDAPHVLFSGQPFTSTLIASNLQGYKYSWIWEKEQGVNFQLAKKQPLKIHEDVNVFSHSGKYQPQGLIPCDIKKSNKGKGGNLGHVGSEAKRKTYTQSHTNFPTTILRFCRDRGFHPTQKPVDLLRYLIRTYTRPDETVLDFTMGSGSTGVAAILEGRKFIGIEKEEKYFEIACQRIGEAEIMEISSELIAAADWTVFETIGVRGK